MRRPLVAALLGVSRAGRTASPVAASEFELDAHIASVVAERERRQRVWEQVLVMKELIGP